MSEAAIREIQTMLAEAGFDPNGIDGLWGRGSRAALRKALDAASAGGPQSTVTVSLAEPVDENDQLLIAELLRDEGFVPHAYKDSLGYWTIGIGRLIDQRRGGGISRDEAEYLKANDIRRFKAALDRKAPWWRDLDPVRRRVILNMTFNMGEGWIDKFTNTVAHIRGGRWEAAASGMLASAWARQVGDRAKRLAQMMRTGRA